MNPDDAAGHAMVWLAAAVLTFTSGATGLFAATVHLVAAQIPDAYLVALAAAALAAGTGMFAWTFKLILQMRDQITELRSAGRSNEKDITDLEQRVRDLERR